MKQYRATYLAHGDTAPEWLDVLALQQGYVGGMQIKASGKFMKATWYVYLWLCIQMYTFHEILPEQNKGDSNSQGCVCQATMMHAMNVPQFTQ